MIDIKNLKNRTMENENNYELENNQNDDLQNNINEEKMLPTEEKKEGVVGPVIGSIIVIILIIIGGMYFWGYIIEKNEMNENNSMNAEATSITDIESDLEKTDIDNLDSDLADIEKEIDAALEE